MGISVWQLLIVLLIAVVLFGTKKLRNIGGDLGAAIKNFRTSMRDGENDSEDEEIASPPRVERDKDKAQIIDGKASVKQDNKI